MAAPYVSTRTGRFQWLMQRVSAVLLIVLAFGHFGLQHFTADAVSTGLTVVNRMNDPFWQAYYVMFVLLAMYHGINGLIGICLDYAPKQLHRGLISLVLWTAGSAFGILGITNIISSPDLATTKSWYAEHGFGAGSSVGSPPSIPMDYDLQKEASEIGMLTFYLEHHVADVSPEQAAEIIGEGDASERGDRLDAWALEQVAEDKPLLADDHRSAIFTNSWEFAHWALNVRQSNTAQRLARDPASARDQQLQTKLAGVPAYQPY